MPTKHIKVTCVGCQCTNEDAEVQIHRVPGYAMQENKAFYGICYDCIACLSAYAEMNATEDHSAFRHEELVRHGNQILEKRIGKVIEIFGTTFGWLSDKEFGELFRQELKLKAKKS